jgi:hypothetical protein
MSSHALPVQDVKLLLCRHLREAGAAGAHHRAQPGTRCRTNRRTAATADRRAESRSEGSGEDRTPNRLVVGRSDRWSSLRGSILLAERLIGSKGVEGLVRPGRDRDHRNHRRLDARRQADRRGDDPDYSSVNTLHVPFQLEVSAILWRLSRIPASG